MLEPIQRVLDNPQDVPDIPLAAKEYLQTRFNHSFLDSTGHVSMMRKAGCSEAHILGFIEGLHYATRVIDEIELIRESNRED